MRRVRIALFISLNIGRCKSFVYGALSSFSRFKSLILSLSF
jgi:hypothetical protein